MDSTYQGRYCRSSTIDYYRRGYGRCWDGASYYFNGLSSAGLNYAEHDSDYILNGAISFLSSGLGNGLGRVTEFSISKTKMPLSAKAILSNFSDSSFSEFSNHEISNTIIEYKKKEKNKK